MNIAIYENTFSKNFQVITEEQAIQAIMTGYYQNQISALRAIGDIKEYKEKKKLLPAFTWSGVFKQGTRLIESIEQYSGLVVLDIDNLDPSNIELLKSQLSQDEFVYFCFASPSGNGIKIIIQVSTGPEHHLAAFLHLQKTFEEKYLFKVDDSGKDVCRLCYVSHDERAIYRHNPSVFQVDIRYGEVGQHKVTAAMANYKPSGDIEHIFKVCMGWVNRTKTYQDGEKNVYIHALACAMNRCGVNMEDTINMITMNIPTPDIKWHQSVKSAYIHNQHEHGLIAVRDIGDGSTQEFVAPPYVANYTDDIVYNDLMRITATLFHQKVPVADIQDIVWKIAQYYNKVGYIDINRTTLAQLMNQAIQVLNQNMASHAAQTALKYVTAEDMGREIVKLDLVKGLIKTYIEPLDRAMYGGMMPGNFYELIGLGGTYKSIIAQSIVYKNAIDDTPALYCNGEMSSYQWYERLIWQAMGIDLREEMYRGRLNDSNIESFIEQLQVYTKRNIFVFNGNDFNRTNILATVEHIRATTGKIIRLIVIDGITQMSSMGKEEVQATIFNAGEAKEIAKATNAVVIGLLHMSGDAGNATLRDTGTRVRGGIKTTANADGYFSTSKLIDPETSSLENPDEVMYLERKIYLRLTDKRTRAGVVPLIVNITDRLGLEPEDTDPRSYEINKNRRN